GARCCQKGRGLLGEYQQSQRRRAGESRDRAGSLAADDLHRRRGCCRFRTVALSQEQCEQQQCEQPGHRQPSAEHGCWASLQHANAQLKEAAMIKERPLASVLTQVVSDLAFLLQTEIRLARAEIGEKLSIAA